MEWSPALTGVVVGSLLAALITYLLTGFQAKRQAQIRHMSDAYAAWVSELFPGGPTGRAEISICLWGNRDVIEALIRLNNPDGVEPSGPLNPYADRITAVVEAMRRQVDVEEVDMDLAIKSIVVADERQKAEKAKNQS